MAMYADVEALKAYARIPEDDTLDDVQIELALTSASREIDTYCGRTFELAGLVATPRYFTARWVASRGAYVVDVDDLVSLEGLEVALDLDQSRTWATAVDAAGVYTLPANKLPWGSLVLPTGSTPSAYPQTVRVTARWGWDAIPDEVVQATLIQANRILKRRDSPFGVAGSAEFGSELRLLNRVDPDVEVLLRSVRKIWGAR